MSKEFKIIIIVLGLIIIGFLPILPVKVETSTERPCSKEEANTHGLPHIPICYTTKTIFISPFLIFTLKKQISNPNYNEVAQKLFVESLIAQGNLVDYKINSINFIGVKSTASQQVLDTYFIPSDSNDAFEVGIDYSVNPTPEKKMDWEAGNGNLSPDGWINNKYSFVTIDKSPTGEYLITRKGTGP